MPGHSYLFVSVLFILTGCTGYVVENDGVYYQEWNEARGSVKRRLKDLDPKTFEVLENDDYGKDLKYVYYRGNPVEGADPQTFEVVEDIYSKDKHRAYYFGNPIESSSSKGFEIIDSYYSNDEKDVYFRTYPLHVCNVKNFKVLPNTVENNVWENWSTDGCHYFYENYKIPSDDYHSVHLFRESNGIAKDRNWAYYRDRKINFNDEGIRILDTIDIATFTVNGYMDCKDKFGCINVIKGRENCEDQSELKADSLTY